MINLIFKNIQEHLLLLDLALASSEKITKKAQAEDLDGVVAETENRERLVNIISKIQHTVEDQINQLNAAELKSSELMILKSWFEDLGLWSEKMIENDRATVEILSHQKENTTREIAHLFKNKEMFKGYSHLSKK